MNGLITIALPWVATQLEKTKAKDQFINPFDGPTVLPFTINYHTDSTIESSMISTIFFYTVSTTKSHRIKILVL